jgi:hypothetical protein
MKYLYASALLAVLLTVGCTDTNKVKYEKCMKENNSLLRAEVADQICRREAEYWKR